MDSRDKYLSYEWQYRKEDLKFCPRCGSRFGLEEMPPGSMHEQLVCDGCRFVFYVDPKVVVTTVTAIDDRVVMLRRAQDPGLGRWSLPGGHIERGEDPFAGAIRETKEETGLDVQIVRLLRLYAVRSEGVIELVFEARAVGGAPRLTPNIESSEIRSFGADQIPWEELAFDSTRRAIAAWRGEGPT